MKTPAEELSEYAAVAWEPGDLIEIRPLPCWGGERAWIKAGELAERAERMTAENERGLNLYAGILPRIRDGGGKAEDVDGGRVLWADFDGCEPEAAIEIIGNLEMPPPSMAVATGHGAHLFWRLEEWTAKDAIHRTMCGLVDFFLSREEARPFIDKGAKDPARILRLPGFINHKPPKARARIVYADPSVRYPLAAFSLSPASPKAAAISPQVAAGDAATERARRYLAMIPGSAKGGRTNTAVRAAAVMVNDMLLSEEQALPLLASWDAAVNVPPIASDYGPEELGKILRNAKKYAKKPAGCLNTRPTATPASDVDLSGIMKRRAKAAKAEAFPERFLEVPGFIGEVMAHNLETAPKPQPILALSGALALQAVLCARKLKDANGTRPNLYLCGVANSGAGKDHARQLNKRILLEAGLSHLQADGIKSGSGLVNALVAQPAILFQPDEFGRFIKTANNQAQSPHVYDIISKLLELYSSSDNVYESDRYADADKGGKQIKAPHAIVYGVTVPRSFYGGLTEESVTDGFLARTLIFDVGETDPTRRRIRQQPIPASVIERAKAWGAFAPPGSGNLSPEPLLVPVTPEADAIGEGFIAKEGEAKERLRGLAYATLWTRTAQNADKLSLLYAASRSPEAPVIDAEAASWGYGLAEWLTRHMERLIPENVSVNPFDAACQTLMRKLREAGGRQARGDLLRRMKIDTGLFSKIIDALQERGEVLAVQFDTHGRPRIEYAISEGSNGEESLGSKVSCAGEERGVKREEREESN